MSSRLLGYFAIQFGVAALAAFFARDDAPLFAYLFLGVISAQYALLGFFFGAADLPVWKRWGWLSLGFAGLLLLSISTEFSMGGELVLGTIRFVTLSVFGALLRYGCGYVLGRGGASGDIQLFRLSLRQLMFLTFAVALFLTLSRGLKDYGGAFYDLALFFLVLFVGLAGALVPVLVAAVAFSKFEIASCIFLALAVSAIAFGLGWFAYSQTDDKEAAILFGSWSVIEAVVMSASVVALRMMGYCLSQGRSPSTSDPRD